MNEILRIIKFILDALLRVWPLLLVTIPLSVIIRELGVAGKINRILNKNIWVTILLATLLGAVSPLCSCSVIPVIASLLTAGFPIGPVMAFWLASPSMDPEIFFLSAASLGWDIATVRLIVTFVMSIVGGIVAHKLVDRWKDSIDILRNRDKFNSTCGCDKGKTDKGNRWKRISKESLKSILLVLRFLIIAFLLEALIIFYVPENIIAGIFTDNEFLSVIISSFISVPLYTTNLAALGIIGGLLTKGLSSRAALAFLIGGATTTIPAMTAVYQLVHKRIFMIYIGITFIFTIMSGILFNIIT